MELPNNIELCTQVFLAQSKPHRIKYVEMHKVVKNHMLKLQELFEGCHDVDVCSRVFTKILEGKKRAKEDFGPGTWKSLCMDELLELVSMECS